MSINKSEICLVAAFIGGIAGVLIGAATTRSGMKDKAIEHGAAKYDEVTGEWEWIEEVEK